MVNLVNFEVKLTMLDLTAFIEGSLDTSDQKLIQALQNSQEMSCVYSRGH